MAQYTVPNSVISYDQKKGIVTKSGDPFLGDLYSKAKFGSQSSAFVLGTRVANKIMAKVPQIVSSSNWTALTIYKHVPSAAAAITFAAVAKLNRVRYHLGLGPIKIVHVKAQRVLSSNYAALSESDRAAYIRDTGYDLPVSEVEGSNVLVIDDVRITGTAEKLVFSLLEGIDYRNLVLGYVAVLEEESARQFPEVEHIINTHTVKEVNDLLPIIHNDDLTPTIRTLKLVLSSDPIRLESFLSEIPPRVINEIYTGALLTGPDFVKHPKHKDGFEVLDRVVTAQPIISG